MSVNKVILVGRLGADPETRYTQDGKTVTKFRLATDSGWGDNRTTDWHRIVTFDKTAQSCEQYLKKGRQVYIEGRVSYSKWEKDGQTQYFTDIIANHVQFLGSKQDDVGSGAIPEAAKRTATTAAGKGGRSKSGGGPRGSSEPEFDDGFSDSDIPF